MSAYEKMLKYKKDPCADVWIERIHDATPYSYEQILNFVAIAQENHFKKWGFKWGLRRPIAHVADVLRVPLPSVAFDEKGELMVIWREFI